MSSRGSWEGDGVEAVMLRGAAPPGRSVKLQRGVLGVRLRGRGGKRSTEGNDSTRLRPPRSLLHATAVPPPLKSPDRLGYKSSDRSPPSSRCRGSCSNLGGVNAFRGFNALRLCSCVFATEAIWDYVLPSGEILRICSNLQDLLQEILNPQFLSVFDSRREKRRRSVQEVKDVHTNLQQ
ncbi:unnamed protein product [Pleuronectes platessa]|uniref:Uncharacterized protein n=1 Tax=Pleuronectes platessa TaxID=8262 RepID=A0A9N7TT99_PLEPL|nr:unnamed protein product [Pleuronectes platessa]